MLEGNAGSKAKKNGRLVTPHQTNTGGTGEL